MAWVEIEGYPDTRMEIKLPKVVDPIPRLVITDKIIGYTCQHVYGQINDIDYESIVVPVYRMDLELKGKSTKSFGVTRDSWYSRGIIASKGFLNMNDDFELTNRHFEPADGYVNLFATVPLNYYGIDAYNLVQNNSATLKAEAHTVKMNTFANGEPINEARPNLAEATEVMIHIAGYYHNEKSKKNKLAGSYGCFGFIPKHQMGSKSKMEEWREDNSYEEEEVSNTTYKKFLNEVATYKGKQEELHVLIKKRNNVEKFRILKDQ